MKIEIYVEGGGAKEQNAILRQGFEGLFRDLVAAGRRFILSRGRDGSLSSAIQCDVYVRSRPYAVFVVPPVTHVPLRIR